MRKISTTSQQAVTVLPIKALGFLQSVLLALVLSVAAFLGLFTPVDGRLYDIFVTHGPSLDSTPRRVVLIDSPVVAFFDPNLDWVKLVDDLIALGAQQVVFAVHLRALLGSWPRCKPTRVWCWDLT